MYRGTIMKKNIMAIVSLILFAGCTVQSMHAMDWLRKRAAGFGLGKKGQAAAVNPVAAQAAPEAPQVVVNQPAPTQTPLVDAAPKNDPVASVKKPVMQPAEAPTPGTKAPDETDSEGSQDFSTKVIHKVADGSDIPKGVAVSFENQKEKKKKRVMPQSKHSKIFARKVQVAKKNRKKIPR